MMLLVYDDLCSQQEAELHQVGGHLYRYGSGLNFIALRSRIHQEEGQTPGTETYVESYVYYRMSYILY